ncbi:hypothetical protein AJ80_09312 [Polytolypa hystricis UAMH7299]|uniref:Uncharacterized protein n=1 Tax=Polytolypa hystricis (strain UAMH7299) TaxID=1447883 RepID=A0A2B7WSY4_POLH7|nr:hypothetical protein AJ80_09312 [Polytolypa hystricis UAMH7299]
MSPLPLKRKADDPMAGRTRLRVGRYPSCSKPTKPPGENHSILASHLFLIKNQSPAFCYHPVRMPMEIADPQELGGACEDELKQLAEECADLSQVKNISSCTRIIDVEKIKNIKKALQAENLPDNQVIRYSGNRIKLSISSTTYLIPLRLTDDEAEISYSREPQAPRRALEFDKAYCIEKTAWVRVTGEIYMLMIF